MPTGSLRWRSRPTGRACSRAATTATLKLWDAATGQLIRTFEGREGTRSARRRAQSVAFSPDGTRCSRAAWIGTLKLWDAATGQLDPHLRGAFRRGQLGGVLARRHAPAFGQPRQDAQAVGRGHRAADPHLRGAFRSRSARWRSRPTARACSRAARTRRSSCGMRRPGASSARFEGHSERGEVGRVLARRHPIVSGSQDTTVRIWDTATGSLIATLIGGRAGEWLAITPKGFFAARSRAPRCWASCAGWRATR